MAPPSATASARRNTELGLLLLVVAVTVGAYVLASLGRDAEIPVDIGPFLLALLAMLLAGNLVTRRLAPEADPVLFPLAALLNGLGYVMIARINESLAGYQALWTAIGLGAMALTLLVVRKARDLAHYRYTAMFVGLGLLALPFVPGIGHEQFGSRIWVRFGGAQFQPAEFAKVALAVFFAGYLYDKRELLRANTRKFGPVHLPDPKYLGPLLGAWAVSILIMVAQRDLGSSLLFFTLFAVMLWIATERIRYLVLGMSMFAAAAYVAWRNFSHVQDRVRNWLDPWLDPWGAGYQVIHSAFYMAAGGIFGVGLGQSGKIERFFAAETDFIFVFIAQELGLLGATLVLMAFLLMVGSGLRIAVRSGYDFDKLLAVGLTTLVGLQAFIIMAGVTRLLPLTGVTLPFVSYGGSSLVANYVIIGLLLRVSDESIRTPAVQRQQARAARARADAALAAKQARAGAKAQGKAQARAGRRAAR